MKNSEKIQNDTKALNKSGRTYLPIRAVMEAFGCTVSWDGQAQAVLIKTGTASVSVTATTELTPEIMSRLQSYSYFLKAPYLDFNQIKVEEPGMAEDVLKDFWAQGVIIFESNEKFITNVDLIYVTYNKSYGLRGILQTTLPDGTIEEQDIEFVIGYGTWEDPNELRFVHDVLLGDKRIIK